LVITADPENMERSEALRLEAESRARSVDGIEDANAVLTADSPPTAASPQRVRKGDNTAKQSLQSGKAEPKSATISGVKRIIAVASAKGGVGKSTVAANLALALADLGYSVGLLDIDVYGPSVPVMMGTADKKPEAGADSKLNPIIAHGLKTMSIGYMVDPDAPMVWRGPVVMSAIMQMLNDVIWATPEKPLDYLILDTPPGTGDAQLTLAQRIPLAGAIIVTTPQEVALADVRRGAAMFAKTHVPVLGIVENMAWFEDPAGNKHHLFGEGGGARMAQSLGLPLLAELPILQSIREGGDDGKPAFLSGGAPAVVFSALGGNVASALETLANGRTPRSLFDTDPDFTVARCSSAQSRFDGRYQSAPSNITRYPTLKCGRVALRYRHGALGRRACDRAG